MVNTKKIHDRMAELDMSKAQLIKLSGLTRVTIDKILAGGEINVKTLEALAKGLGVNVGFFFDDCIQPNSQLQIGGSDNMLAGHDANNAINLAEHDELIRLRVEVKMLQEQVRVAQKAYENIQKAYEHLQKMNEFLMGQK